MLYAEPIVSTDREERETQGHHSRVFTSDRPRGLRHMESISLRRLRKTKVSGSREHSWRTSHLPAWSPGSGGVGRMLLPLTRPSAQRPAWRTHIGVYQFDDGNAEGTLWGLIEEKAVASADLAAKSSTSRSCYHQSRPAFQVHSSPHET